MLSIFLATHGHTATIDVAAKAEELRDKFIKKLQESSLTGEDISNITTQSEELLNQLKSADDSDASIQKRGEALADLLTLKYPVHDTALNEGLILKSASRQPIIIESHILRI
jgi:flagellar biosynthesis/type III secretory pathway chaperone